MNKIKVFENLLNKFETEEIKNYCTDMIKEIPDYIFTIPSSTSFKYHNKTQCQPHGQIFHILMFAEVMKKQMKDKETAYVALQFFMMQSSVD